MFLHQPTRLPDGRVLVTGGSCHGKSVATSEIYDPARRTFTRMNGLMSVRREDHTATLLADGRLLITGGEDNQAGPGKTDVVLRGADLLDLKSMLFTRPDDLGSARDDHRATLLTDGRVFIFGGQTTSGKVLDSGEFFVP